MNASLRRALPAVIAVLTVGAAGAAHAQNAAIVNGKAIPSARVDEFVAALTQQGRPDTPELRTAVRDELIAREIFVQEAERKGLTRSTDVARQLEQTRQDILIRAVIREHLKNNPVTDAELKAEYERLTKGAAGGDKEYRARHILVENEAEAKSLIAQLKAGASFEELAKKYSKDPGSGAQGGDLDFAKADSYVPEFGQALTQLKKGQMTEVPVKTQFGWHIIKLEDTREAEFPAFDDVKSQIVQRMEQIKLQQYQEDLRKAAKTDYKFVSLQ